MCDGYLAVVPGPRATGSPPPRGQIHGILKVLARSCNSTIKDGILQINPGPKSYNWSVSSGGCKMSIIGQTFDIR
jgi:hypothetical protein